MHHLKRRLMSAAVLGCLIISACSKPQSVDVITSPVNSVEAINATANNMTAVDLPTVPAPTPHYQEREGDRYLYVTKVSEEDHKKGQVVGSVVQYQFLGEINGKLIFRRLRRVETLLVS